MFPTYTHARLIGFGHKARQGKDLAVKFLQQSFPGRVHRVSFADALRAVCRVEYGMTAKDAPLLQQVGVARRESDPDVWVKAVAWAIAELDAEATAPFLVGIPDCRFENEVAFVESRGTSCRVRRFLNGAQVVATDRPATHVSETALDHHAWRYTIDCVSGDLMSLRAHVQRLGRLVLGEARPMPVVYVAGKFRDRTPWLIEQHVREAETVALEVWRLGCAALCPHANTRYFQDAAPDHVWLDGDMEMLIRSDALVTVANWRESVGATEEVRVAEARGIPVFHSIDELRAWMVESA